MPNITIEVSGGLGNQLFQFSLGTFILNNLPGVKIRFDKTNYKLANVHEGFLLDDFISRASDMGNQCCAIEYNSIYQKKIFYKIAQLRKILCIEPVPYQYMINLLTNRCSFISGSWQSYKYLQNNSSIRIIGEVLKSKFCDLNHPYSITDCKEKIIALHVRRGDYLHNINAGYGVLPMQYYFRAMNLARSINGECKFLIFTDDYEYVKRIFEFNDCMIVSDLYGQGAALRDLYLMSVCDGLITANSSLSWWGGMLQQKSNVITPAKWFLDRSKEALQDFLPLSWIKVSI